MSNPKLTAITIVGGGTAGWMTAALLSKVLIGFDISLIESDEIGTIGVGEATIPAIKIFNHMLGLNEAEFMRATQATFKLGIEFANWRAPDHSYIHGFGKIGTDLLWLHTHQFWLKMKTMGPVPSFDHYALNCMAARQGSFLVPDRTQGPPLSDLDYAYHFDATLYAQYLRKFSEERGVKRIEGKITTVHLNPLNGFIDNVGLVSGQTIAGDLFIDCSGMRSLLLGDALGVGFEDWSQWLLCDRALAVPCERIMPLPPHTRSMAHGSGWQWRIPLQHRTGNGHVYSSTHMSDDEAHHLLMTHLDHKPTSEARKIQFRPGKRLRAFEKNCVAIGLSAGFLEPLESTSIHLIQTGLLRLLSLFPGQAFHERDRLEYNRQTDFEYNDIRDFIIAHYKVTHREDTPFWAYLKHMSVPTSLQDKLDLFSSSARLFRRSAAELFTMESWIQVLLGQDIAVTAHDPMVDMIPLDDIKQYLRDIEEVIAHHCQAMPPHEAFIARYCKA